MSDSVEPAFVLAVDLGSSGPKVTLFSDRGQLVAQSSASVATQITADGGGEQDPSEWWNSTTACVRAVLADRVVPVERIMAIAIASQWSVTVPVDREGRHLMNAVHWTDSRGAPYTKAITDGLIRVSGYGLRRMLAWVRLTGGVPTHSGADALAHILFIKHERPDVYRRTYKFLEPMDYLNLRLTGRACASYATVFPYLLTDNRDNQKVVYSQRLIDWCGLDRDKLPELLPVGTVLGSLLPASAEVWGLSPGTAVITGTPDSQAAAVGSGAVQDLAGHVCVGTTAWLSCHVSFKKTNVMNYLATMPSAIAGRNMVTAEQGAAGKCLQSLVDNWLFPDGAGDPPAQRAGVYQEVERLAASVPPGSEGLLFLPWLNGAGPPSGDSTMRGGFLNQSLRTGRAHAARAVIEGVAFNLRWLRCAVERFVGRPFAELNYIGRTANSELWCQTLADVLERPIHRMVEPGVATARGAALAALVAMGRITVDQIPALVPVERTFTPRADYARLYADLFAVWLASYKATRPLFRQLQRVAPVPGGAID
ncbi:MAG: FGGY-family carbohydrate kinase [Pirellulales bacterium]